MGKTTEIELKAHVDHSVECKEKLTVLAGQGAAFYKDDAYWFVPLPPNAAPRTRNVVRQTRNAVPQGAVASGLPASGLRVRREKAGESEHTWITWKDKERRDGFEVNEEHEFEVSSGADFEELLARLGLEKRIHKRKQGWNWQYLGITVELCEVSAPGSLGAPKNLAVPKNLGWFLELEILANDDSAETVTAAREQLLSLLEQAGIGKENIENRYYSELLAD